MRKGFALDDDRLKNLVHKTQIFHQNIIDAPETSWYFIFDENGNYLKANLLKSRDAKPEGAKVRKSDHVSRLLLFPYIEKM